MAEYEKKLEKFYLKTDSNFYDAERVTMIFGTAR